MPKSLIFSLALVLALSLLVGCTFITVPEEGVPLDTTTVAKESVPEGTVPLDTTTVAKESVPEATIPLDTTTVVEEGVSAPIDIPRRPHRPTSTTLTIWTQDLNHNISFIQVPPQSPTPVYYHTPAAVSEFDLRHEWDYYDITYVCHGDWSLYLAADNGQSGLKVNWVTLYASATEPPDPFVQMKLDTIVDLEEELSYEPFASTHEDICYSRLQMPSYKFGSKVVACDINVSIGEDTYTLKLGDSTNAIWPYAESPS